MLQRRKKAEKLAKAEKSREGSKAASAAKNDDQHDFTKMDIRVGVVQRVWVHETADKLYCEEIDVGEESPREIASGLRESYSLEELEGRLVAVVCNLKASKIVGFTSNGMVLAGKSDDGKVTSLVDPPPNSKPGERLFLEGKSGEPQSSTQMKKRKTWDTVKKSLKVDGGGNATFDGEIIRGEMGGCTVKGLSEGSCIA